MTHSFLTFDNASLLPIPEEIKELTKETDWGKHEWDAIGLPENGNYSIVGKQLYFDSLINGPVSVRKQEITTDIIVCSYFINPDLEGNNYMLVLTATFLKGELIEVKLNKLLPFLAKEFNQLAKEISSKAMRMLKMQKSWWYKYLYRPYSFIIFGLAYFICIILNLLKNIISWIAYFITPI